MRRDQRDFFRADLDPGIKGRRVRTEVRRKRIDEIRCFFLRRGIGSERNASGERNRAYEEVTTGKGLDRLHLKPPKLLPPHGSLPEYGGRCHSGTNCPTSRCLSRDRKSTRLNSSH